MKLSTNLFLMSLIFVRFSFNKPPIFEEENSSYKSKHDLPIPENIDLSIDPLDLINWWRSDIVAKYIYAMHRELGVKSDWAKRLYAEHIHVWGNYKEWDGSKNSLLDYLNAFDIILDSIKKQSFDPTISKIEIDPKGYSRTGSHRIAACLLYKKNIIARLKKQKATHSSLQFFRHYTNFVPTGLEEKYLDAIALQYCKLKNSTCIIIIFSADVQEIKEAKYAMRLWGDIVYEKKISLTSKGALNLANYFYENLLGIIPHSAYSKKMNTQAPSVFLLEYNENDKASLENIEKRLTEQNITYCLSNKSHRTTVHCAQMLFVENSIVFLNTADTVTPEKKFEKLLFHYKNWIETTKLDSEQFCIIVKSVPAISINTNFENIEFISHQNNIPTPPMKIKNVTPSSSLDSDEIIFNPENHFYYKGLKIAEQKLN